MHSDKKDRQKNLPTTTRPSWSHIKDQLKDASSLWEGADTSAQAPECTTEADRRKLLKELQAKLEALSLENP